MKIEKAIRKSLPAVICLYGESGSGKTFSALKLAHGLVANAKNNRVCVIDTENHRASHYDADFDFDVDVSVDVLGRIFEQSVTDLEQIRALQAKV